MRCWANHWRVLPPALWCGWALPLGDFQVAPTTSCALCEKPGTGLRTLVSSRQRWTHKHWYVLAYIHSVCFECRFDARENEKLSKIIDVLQDVYRLWLVSVHRRNHQQMANATCSCHRTLCSPNHKPSKPFDQVDFTTLPPLLWSPSNTACLNCIAGWEVTQQSSRRSELTVSVASLLVSLRVKIWKCQSLAPVHGKLYSTVPTSMYSHSFIRTSRKRVIFQCDHLHQWFRIKRHHTS